MKYLEKAAGILNDIFDGCLVLLCLCVLMIGSYTMYDIYMYTLVTVHDLC